VFNRTPEDPLEDQTPKFATVSGWCAMTGMSRTGTYEALGLGYLTAVKAGRRTLIDAAAGLVWLHSLPRATFRAPKLAMAIVAKRETVPAARACNLRRECTANSAVGSSRTSRPQEDRPRGGDPPTRSATTDIRQYDRDNSQRVAAAKGLRGSLHGKLK
jgi:hypothetical protein